MIRQLYSLLSPIDTSLEIRPWQQYNSQQDSARNALHPAHVNYEGIIGERLLSPPQYSIEFLQYPDSMLQGLSPEEQNMIRENFNSFMTIGFECFLILTH